MKNFVLATFAALILVLSMTSGHIALAYNSKFTNMFSNSGNNQETQQECGNSCTVTSSNTITFGSSGLTAPPPSPTPTSLTLAGVQFCAGESQVTGPCSFLETNTGSPVAGATITFTGFNLDENAYTPVYVVSGFPMDLVTNSRGYYQVQLPSQTIRILEDSFTNITAHYAGSAAFGASNSNTIPADSFSS